MNSFNVNVNISGLEGLTAVLEKLVSVTSCNLINAATPIQETHQIPLVPAASMQAYSVPTYIQQAPTVQFAQTVPALQPLAEQTLYAVGQQPVTAGQQPVAAVPIAAPAAYSMEQLAVAATQLIDAGRRQDVVALLGAFGVQALTELPKEQYGAFVTQLRAMGAKI